MIYFLKINNFIIRNINKINLNHIQYIHDTTK